MPLPIGVIFRAIANPTRRDLLELLRAGPQSAGQIALRFPVSRAAISKHIQELRRSGLVKEVRRGRNRFYWLNVQPLDVIKRWLESYRPLGSRRSNIRPIEGKRSRKQREVVVSD